MKSARDVMERLETVQQDNSQLQSQVSLLTKVLVKYSTQSGHLCARVITIILLTITEC